MWENGLNVPLPKSAIFTVIFSLTGVSMLDDESSDCTSMDMDEAATISPSSKKFDGLVADSKDGPC